MNVQIFLASGLTIASLLILIGCAPDPKETQINTRLKSPDGSLEAVYAENIGGGPAVGVSEEVFVVLPGLFPTLSERVFSEECVRNINLAWENDQTLRVSYDIASDIRENPSFSKPSLISMFSSGYWTSSHPHGVGIHFVRRLMPAGSGC